MQSFLHNFYKEVVTSMSKKEQIKKQQAQFLEIMKKVREEKDIDALAELFIEIISVYG